MASVESDVNLPETDHTSDSDKSAELSASQRARIERNRQKALLLRQSRLQAHPYATDHLGYKCVIIDNTCNDNKSN